MMNKYDEKFLERFWSKVSKGGPDECWNWLGGTSGGYGRCYSKQHSSRYAHRISLELFLKGPITFGLIVMHECDNPLCVNPKHLSIGTRGDNNRDATKRGRIPRGEKNHNSKLTEQDICEIRASSKTNVELAKRCSVDPITISRARRYITWKHVK